MIALSMVVVFLCVLLYVLYRQRKREHEFFKELGVAGPSPHILWGHYDKFRSGHVQWLERWSSQYGNTFGIFLGSKPVIVSTDADFAQYVLVKNFPNFVERAPLFTLERCDPLLAEFLSFTPATEWRRQRRIITPAFNTVNSKELLVPIRQQADKFVQSLLGHQRNGERFDALPLIKTFAMTNIGQTVFGVDLDNVDELRSLNVAVALHTAATGQMVGFLDMLANCFHLIGVSMRNVIRSLYSWGVLQSPFADLGKVIEAIIRRRREGHSNNDLLQRFIHAADSLNPAEQHERQQKTLYLTNSELISNCVGMFLVGFETTSYSLAYILHCLGQRLGIQDKLRQEILAKFGKEDVPQDTQQEYSDLMEMKYLDAVIKEALRLFPPATGFTTRQAHEAFVYGSTKFPAGMNFLFVTSVIHRDSRYWPDPMIFKPERFLGFSGETIHPGSFQPFGDGPRNCVGMRLVMLTLKVVLARILINFRVKSYKKAERVSKTVLCMPTELELSLEPL